MDYSSPLAVYETRCKPEWIDFNGHMNVAHYLSIFDLATDAFLESMGLGQSYREAANSSFFALECRINYQREVMLDEALNVTLQMLDVDAKRFHFFLRMFNRDRGTIVATAEQLGIHVDLVKRHSSLIPRAAFERIEGVMAAHAALPRPAETDRKIGIRRRERPETK